MVNSTIVAVLGLILLSPIVKGLGAQENTFEYTRQYVRVILAGVMVVSATELCIMAVYGIFAPALIGIFTDSAEVIATGSRVPL